MTGVQEKFRETDGVWPENPDAGWLGKWAATQDDLPYVISLRIVRAFYQDKRRAALSRAET